MTGQVEVTLSGIDLLAFEKMATALNIPFNDSLAINGARFMARHRIQWTTEVTAQRDALAEALEAHEAHFARGVSDTAAYIVPSVDPWSICVDEFVSRMIEHFDGLNQRSVQAKARAALASMKGQEQ